MTLLYGNGWMIKDILFEGIDHYCPVKVDK